MDHSTRPDWLRPFRGAWPMKPNPVISVQAWAPRAASIPRPLRFRSHHTLHHLLERPLGEAISPFRAVEMTPVPRGFVKTSRSPGLALALLRILSGMDDPCHGQTILDLRILNRVTSDQGNPASSIFERPPRRISLKTEGERVLNRKGNQIQGRKGFSSHGVDIAEGIHHSDLAEGERDHRRWE